MDGAWGTEGGKVAGFMLLAFTLSERCQVLVLLALTVIGLDTFWK